MSESAIGWTEQTWNPVIGCSHVSDGCRNCYAETLSLRRGWTPKPWTANNAAENVILKPHKLDEPLRRRKPTMYFVNSMSDLFHEQIPDQYIAAVFAVMADSPQHTFQVLTKRPERMRDLLRGGTWHLLLGEACAKIGGPMLPALTLPNVWLGTSIESRRHVDRADVLRETPAAVRFISAEPLLGPLIAKGRVTAPPLEWEWPDAYDGPPIAVWEDGYNGPELDLAGIDWLIAGGESGPKWRPMDLQWVRDLRDACQASGTAFFYKQNAGLRPGKDRELDGRTWDEYPSAAQPSNATLF